MTRLRHMLMLAALACATAGGTATFAQQDPATAPTDEAARDKAARDTAAKDKTAKDEADTRQPALGSAPQPVPNRTARATDGQRERRSASEKGGQGLTERDRDNVRGFMQSEAKYRMRMARIKRLRELAEEKGDTERLATLAKLEKKLGDLHAKQVQRWRERLGDEKFKQMKQRLTDRMERRKKRRGAGRGGERDRAGDRTADRERREGKGRRAGDRPERDRDDMRDRDETRGRRQDRGKRGEDARQRRRDDNRDDGGRARRRRPGDER